MELLEHEDGEAQSPQWELSELKPKHLQVCSLLAQGFKNVDVAKMVGITPEYVSMLLRQPLIKSEIARIAEIAGTRLEALFEQSVDVIAEVMANGNHGDQLKAVRLQLEATKRIGRPDVNPRNPVDATDRLEALSHRLIDLLGSRQGRIFDESGKEITDGRIPQYG
jgi:hypothetical protein